MEQLTIYALLLNGNNYYIGKTTKNIEERFNEHLAGSAAWTTLHKPIKILETINTTDPIVEDTITKKYMCMYGIEQVRGGSYTKIVLDDWMIKALDHEFTSIDNRCYKCKQPGHFAKDCNTSLIKYYNLLINCSESITISNENDIVSIIDNEIERLGNLIPKIKQLNQTIDLTNSITIDMDRRETRSIEKKTYEINRDLFSIVDKFIIINGQYETLDQRPRNHMHLTSADIEQHYLRIEQDKVYVQLQELRRKLSMGYYPLIFINTDNYKIIILQIMNYNKDKKRKLDEIIENEVSIELIESKIEFLLNKRFNKF
jgi:hypothetical protein